MAKMNGHWAVMLSLTVLRCTAPAAVATDAADTSDASDDAEVATASDVAAAVDIAAGPCGIPCKGDEFCDLAAKTCASRPTEAAAESARMGCQFGPGDRAEKSVGLPYPIDKAIPIDHFVLVMMENRSFDHYFGAAQQFGIAADGFVKDAGNPDKDGSIVLPHHATPVCINDVEHGWSGVHKQYNNGKMDGFVLTNNPNGKRAMGYFDGDDLPFYYDVAKKFGISDRHYCSVLGPTWINRFYYVAATSFGRTENKAPPAETMQGMSDHQILARLDAAGVDWRIYASDFTVFLLFSPYIVQDANFDRFRPISEYFADAKAGKLPAVAFVEPTFSQKGAIRNDEHPPGTPFQGEQFTHAVVQALMDSPNWPTSAYIQTYDEHGGFYDHVSPPPACKPDDFAPDVLKNDPGAAFDRYGMRVPLLVISPWSKPGYVSHRTSDNTSMMRLVEARFGLPALTKRDANAWPLLDFFDFSQPHYPTAPAMALPRADKQSLIDGCVMQFP